MFRSMILRIVLVTAFALACGSGCDEGGDDRVALSGIVSDPVGVDIGLVYGHITLDFSPSPLDPDDANALETLLTQGAVGLSLTNDGTGVSVDLTDGTAVPVEPEQPGEYLAEVSADGTTVTVTFTNSFDGYSLHAGGDYSASIDVATNDFFATESFLRQVDVAE